MVMGSKIDEQRSEPPPLKPFTLQVLVETGVPYVFNTAKTVWSKNSVHVGPVSSIPKYTEVEYVFWTDSNLNSGRHDTRWEDLTVRLIGTMVPGPCKVGQ